MMLNKKGEMPWWLVLLILSVFFLAIMSFVSGGIVKKGLASIGIVQDQTDKQASCLVIFDKSIDKDGDGWSNKEGCDACDNNPKAHTTEDCQKT